MNKRDAVELVKAIGAAFVLLSLFTMGAYGLLLMFSDAAGTPAQEVVTDPTRVLTVEEWGGLEMPEGCPDRLRFWILRDADGNRYLYVRERQGAGLCPVPKSGETVLEVEL